MKKLIIYMIAIVLAVACSSGEKSRSPVLAKVDGKEITKEDYLKRLSRMPPWATMRFQNDQGKRDFLEEMIKEEILFRQAKKMRLHKDSEYEERLEEFKRMSLVALLLKKEVEEQTRVSLEEAREFFEKNRDEFNAGLEVRARHVLVETEAEAEDILKEIKAGGNFEKLATEFSKDKTSAAKGGDLGFFGRGRMVPEFERVAFRLKKGEVSGPVRTRFGYHIMKITDRKEGTPQEFEAVRDAVLRRAKVEKQKGYFESYVGRLKAEVGTIDIYDEALADVTIPRSQAQGSGAEPR